MLHPSLICLDSDKKMKNRNQNKCLISQSWIFYPSFVAKSDCDGNKAVHVAPTNVQLHRAMRAQPFTDKLIRNICRSRFCIFVTQLCVYSLAWRRYVSVYLLLISSDSPKLARSIQTELMKQNVRKEKTIEWWMFSSSSHVDSNNRDTESFLKRKLKSQLHVVNCGRFGARERQNDGGATKTCVPGLWKCGSVPSLVCN